jgi:hypothetical protein
LDRTIPQIGLTRRAFLEKKIRTECPNLDPHDRVAKRATLKKSKIKYMPPYANYFFCVIQKCSSSISKILFVTCGFLGKNVIVNAFYVNLSATPTHIFVM